MSLILLSLMCLGSLVVQDETLDFNRDIRPILSENCFYCHGPDKSHREAGLRLDDREGAIKKKAIAAGDSKNSSLIERIFSKDADTLMPPPDSRKKLSEEQKQILKKWIEQGAKYSMHWAYEPPVKKQVPAGVNPVDHFVGVRLAKVGLKPSPEADRRILARRLYFDLIGLPPKPSDVEAFLNDKSPDAYGKLVNALLQNPHYGERMAIGWLDVVRFADTIGYHSDTPRNIWPYRDWVIQSFNSNKRFDRFTLEQIAGDLLPDASQETRVGSGFNRLLLTTEEGGAQAKDYESRMLTDRVRAVGTAWLGQTTGCAQCHDHKYDPFTSKDFYAMGAFFADIKETAIGRREEGMPVLDPQQAEQLQILEMKLKALQGGKSSKEEVASIEKAIKAIQAASPKTLVSVSMDKKRVVRILPRGNWMDDSGEIMKAAFPAYLPAPKSNGKEPGRMELAKWLVSRENPLTARTVMNRLWKQFFGMGLSKVLDDLGAQGELPPNQDLLDWLACEFMDSGWDFNHMVKTIVLSKTYRQTSTPTAEQVQKDPYNREHARQSRFRLDAELVRDNALDIAGLLNGKIGGPSAKPYQPDRYWENLNFPTREYSADKDVSQYRRGLYVWWQRTFLHPSLLAFDAPSREECTAERSRSNIPQQALVLLNDPSYVEAARAFASRILKESNASTNERIRWAFQLALQRNPDQEELRTLHTLFEKHLAQYRKDPQSAANLLKVGLIPVPKELDGAELAAWTHLARVILNLHETITRF